MKDWFKELFELGSNSCVVARLTLVSDINRTKSLRFVKDYKNCTVEQWGRSCGPMSPDLLLLKQWAHLSKEGIK